MWKENRRVYADRSHALEGDRRVSHLGTARRAHPCRGLAAHWPNAPAEQQVLAEPLNALPKYIASTILREPLAWQNARLLRGDIGAAVRALKVEEGNDLHVIGSPGLVQTLIGHDLIDEMRLMIDPLVLGGGKRLSPQTARPGGCASAATR